MLQEKYRSQINAMKIILLENITGTKLSKIKNFNIKEITTKVVKKTTEHMKNDTNNVKRQKND